MYSYKVFMCFTQDKFYPVDDEYIHWEEGFEGSESSNGYTVEVYNQGNMLSRNEGYDTYESAKKAGESLVRNLFVKEAKKESDKFYKAHSDCGSDDYLSDGEVLDLVLETMTPEEMTRVFRLLNSREDGGAKEN